MKMKNYIPIKKSQFHYFTKLPIYIQTTADRPVLYKAENKEFDITKFHKDSCPQLFIPSEYKDLAFNEINKNLRIKLYDRIQSGDLKSIKHYLNEMLQEVFEEPDEKIIQGLPETIDVIFDGGISKNVFLANIEYIEFGGTTLVEHSTNIMVLALNYCIFNRLDDAEARHLGLAALLHDIGLTRVSNEISQVNRKLTENEFEIYSAHPTTGYGIIKEISGIDPSVALAALEHHERTNGQGYPRGISNISHGGCLLGILDCFDNLTNTHKAHKKNEGPFGALKIIQKEILQEKKFDKEIFRNLCLSLVGKRRYN
jgi:response regulator RpfG family c-di-GMP phosphodiesterase